MGPFPADPRTERVPSLAERVAYFRNPINLRLFNWRVPALSHTHMGDPLKDVKVYIFPVQPNRPQKNFDPFQRHQTSAVTLLTFTWRSHIHDYITYGDLFKDGTMKVLYSE